MNSRSRQRGFTMIELMIVIVIILVVSAMAIPSVMTAMYNIRLRSSGSEVAGLLQSARMQSIQFNKTFPLNCTPQPLSSCTVLYVDLTGTGAGAYGCVVISPGNPCTNEPTISLPGTVRFSTGGFPAIPPATLGFLPLVNQQIAFNSRGLPCLQAPGGGPCGPAVGFVFYFQDQRSLGTNGYMAVAVTPAGRIRVYSYDRVRGWFQS